MKKYSRNFEIYSLDEYDDYIFLVSESENSELFIFEKDTVFSSRYYYVTDSRGLVDDNTSIGIIIAYLKKNNEKESSKVLLSFSNNNIGITNCEYSYNDEIKNISIDPDKGFVFAISHSNFNYLMEEVVESMQFIDEKGNIIH